MIGDIVLSDALTPTLSHGEREENRSNPLVRGEGGKPFQPSRTGRGRKTVPALSYGEREEIGSGFPEG